MSNTGAIAAAAAVRSERRLVRSLRDQGAVSRDRAVALHPERLPMRGALRRLVRNDAVVAVDDDRYWLDEGGYERFRERRRTRVLFVILLVVIVVALVAAVSLTRS